MGTGHIEPLDVLEPVSNYEVPMAGSTLGMLSDTAKQNNPACICLHHCSCAHGSSCGCIMLHSHMQTPFSKGHHENGPWMQLHQET